MAASACGGAPAGECKRVRTDLDLEADGRVDEVETRSYNGAGKLAKTERYLGTDPYGTPIRRTTYNYNDRNDLASAEVDQPLDGNADTILRYVYENDRRARVEYDSDPDGERDRVTRFVYDDSGDRIREENDENFDGEPESVTRMSYADGNLRKIENDEDADGNADSQVTYEYENGRRSRHNRDTDADGNTDLVLTYEYGSGDNVDGRELYEGEKPTGDPIRRWSYAHECPPPMTE